MSDHRKEKYFLDTNVLFSSLTRDLLLTCCQHFGSEVFWSDHIMLKLRKNLKIYLDQHGVPNAAVKVDQLAAQLNKAFPKALIESIKQGYIGKGWPDSKDEQVVRDAIRAKATVIITFNIKDFPQVLMRPIGLRAVTPDQFLLDHLKSHNSRLFDMLDTWLIERHRPAYTRATLMDRLREVQLIGFAEALKEAWESTR